MPLGSHHLKGSQSCEMLITTPGNLVSFILLVARREGSGKPVGRDGPVVGRAESPEGPGMDGVHVGQAR